MVRWMIELDKVLWTCAEADREIREEDPSLWWRETERGDWMLFYMSGLLTLRGQRDKWVVDRIAAYMKCPKTFGEYIWNSSVPQRGGVTRSLAQRVRAVWPDLPLVV